jgi:hypothetical protein
MARRPWWLSQNRRWLRTASDPTGSLAAAHLPASRRVGTGRTLCPTAFAPVDSDRKTRQGEVRSSGRVMAAGTPRHLSSGGSGWLAPVDGNSGPGLRLKALANRAAPAFRCQRLASRASRSSSSQCQGPSRMRRRIRTGPWTAQTAVRLTGSSFSSVCVALAMLESSSRRAPTAKAVAALGPGPDPAVRARWGDCGCWIGG